MQTVTYGNGTTKDISFLGDAIHGGSFTIPVAGLGDVALDPSVVLLYYIKDSADIKTYLFSGACPTADDVKANIIPNCDTATPFYDKTNLYFSTGGSAVYGPLVLQ